MFGRDGEQGAKIFKVCEILQDGKHTIIPNLEELAKIGFAEEEVKNIIASVYAELDQPFRG